MKKIFKSIVYAMTIAFFGISLSEAATIQLDFLVNVNRKNESLTDRIPINQSFEYSVYLDSSEMTNWAGDVGDGRSFCNTWINGGQVPDTPYTSEILTNIGEPLTHTNVSTSIYREYNPAGYGSNIPQTFQAIFLNFDGSITLSEDGNIWLSYQRGFQSQGLLGDGDLLTSFDNIENLLSYLESLIGSKIFNFNDMYIVSEYFPEENTGYTIDQYGYFGTATLLRVNNIAPDSEPEPDIGVDILQYDFGEVEIGTSSTVYINVSNTGNESLSIHAIYLLNTISGQPFTADFPSLPLEIDPGASIDIPVSYSPSLLLTEQVSTLVLESNDSDESIVEVNLKGNGVVSAGDTSEKILSIKEYIDSAAENGTLAFVGDGGSGVAHFEALNNMLTSAGSAENSCGPLQAIYKRIDGNPKQRDWVEGPATEGIAYAILDAMNNLGCK